MVPVAVPAGPAHAVTISWFGRYVVDPDAPEEFEVTVNLHFTAHPTEAARRIR